MLQYCISGPAEPWPGSGSGPGQVTSQETRRAVTCGSRADRPGTDVSGCQMPKVLLVPAAAADGLCLPCCLPAVVRSFGVRPQAMGWEGGGRQ